MCVSSGKFYDITVLRLTTNSGKWLSCCTKWTFECQNTP